MNLDTPITKLPLVGPVYAKRLKKLDIETISDILHHVPHRYLDFRLVSKISEAQVGEIVTVRGEVASIKNQYTRGGLKIQLAEITDDTGRITAVWFNQPFLVKTLALGSSVSLAGKVDWFGRKPALISPEYEKKNTKGKSIHTGRLIPIYPETQGISSKWLRGRISYTHPQVSQNIEEFLPQNKLDSLKLPTFAQSIEAIHFPENFEDADIARRRLAFNELLMLQLATYARKALWQKNEAVSTLKIDYSELKSFVENLPFTLTKSQLHAVDEILKDLQKTTPMNRLLEGDVGSGKTVVAAIAAFTAFANGYQSVFMAPTQILAQQHFVTLNEIFKPFSVRVTLATSEGVKKGPGKTDIFVGTHALIHKRVSFDNVALVVIDEQHRFGVEQRAHLVDLTGKKKKAPHLLTMTATPIPRTVALTLYGDLDLSTLNELPKGRQKITTWIVPPQKRQGAYGWIDKEIEKESAQAFLICPLIEESEAETMKQVKAATVEYKNLKKLFVSRRVGLLHGKMKAKDKDIIMQHFKKGELDILVSTPVVEVGIDIPNATIMVIEAAERFGLSQLHQLRGRVGRGAKKSYCLLFAESHGQNVITRLNALTKGLYGFELAELDLKLRGPGEVFGTRQHGFLDLKIANWQDTELIKKAEELAQEAFAKPKKFSKLLTRIKSSKIDPN